MLLSEIAGTRRTSRNLADRIKELDAQSLTQQEHVYAAEFQIQQMERKVRGTAPRLRPLAPSPCDRPALACHAQIARARGDVSDEERKVLEARIRELNGDMEEAAEMEKGLQAQVKQVKEDLKKALRAQADLTESLTTTKASIDELLLQNRRCGGLAPAIATSSALCTPALPPPTTYRACLQCGGDPAQGGEGEGGRDGAARCAEAGGPQAEGCLVHTDG